MKNKFGIIIFFSMLFITPIFLGLYYGVDGPIEHNKPKNIERSAEATERRLAAQNKALDAARRKRANERSARATERRLAAQNKALDAARRKKANESSAGKTERILAAQKKAAEAAPKKKAVAQKAAQKKSKKSAGGFTIPTDSKASYRIESVKKLGADTFLVISYRDGPSGEVYVAREVWCKRRRFRYLTEGGDVQELVAGIRQYGETISYDENPMSGLVAGSISWYLVKRACKGKS